MIIAFITTMLSVRLDAGKISCVDQHWLFSTDALSKSLDNMRCTLFHLHLNIRDRDTQTEHSFFCYEENMEKIQDFHHCQQQLHFSVDILGEYDFLVYGFLMDSMTDNASLSKLKPCCQRPTAVILSYIFSLSSLPATAVFRNLFLPSLLIMMDQFSNTNTEWYNSRHG